MGSIDAVASGTAAGRDRGVATEVGGEEASVGAALLATTARVGVKLFHKKLRLILY